jgi:peptide/nickel transport system substrate-binding protein
VSINVKRRILFVILALVLTCVIVLAGCGKATTTTPAATTPTATTPVASQPVSGGTLRLIAGAIPKNIGYPPEKAPNDTFQMAPAVERLCEWGSNNGELVPVLATSWESDHAANTITYHLRQGVKFHDGTDLNAEAVRWNIQLQIDNRSGTGTNLIESMEVIGDYTIVMHMISFDWQTVQQLGLTQPISPTAFMTAGGSISADDTSDEAKEARIEWARLNVVGTGAFTVTEFVRDDHITFVKNPNYWQPGKPYLDKIIMMAIPDPMVASAKLQAGEADMWADTSSMNDILLLEEKNFTLVPGPGMFEVMLISDVDPNSPLSNLKVRQAILYGLDRPTIAQTLGQGYYEALTQMAPKGRVGYVPGYDPYPYNVEKAQQLLEEAGFGVGF